MKSFVYLSAFVLIFTLSIFSIDDASAVTPPQFLFKFGSLGSGDGEFGILSCIAVDNSEKIFVSDTGNNRIQVFGSSDTISPSVAGEIVALNTTALFISSLSSSMIWMAPVIVGIAGVGAYFIKSKKN